MVEWIAERKLRYSRKGVAARHEVVIRIGQPYLLQQGMVNFEFNEGTAGCSFELTLDEDYSHEVYGADSLQVLQLAADVEPVLKELSKKYDFFFPDGEPYFEPDEDG
jgi:acyl carrier protein